MHETRVLNILGPRGRKLKQCIKQDIYPAPVEASCQLANMMLSGTFFSDVLS